MVQERLELEISQSSRSGSVHASLMASSRRRRGKGIVSGYLSDVAQHVFQVRHFYPQNTTNYHLELPSWCVSHPLLAKHVLSKGPDPRMWLHTNNVARLFGALWHARDGSAGRCSPTRLGSSHRRGDYPPTRTHWHNQSIASGGASLRDGRN
jgi:hypothetical protein